MRIGCILHDVGKILHPVELEIEGNQHTTAGQQLLLQNGVSPEIAAICVSHHDWQARDCSLEECLVALADKLWKGSRKQELETAVIQRISEKTGRDFWEIFIELDSGFETIAINGLSKITSSI